MTDKELKKLSRLELLEILCELRKKLDETEQENASLKQQLEEQNTSLALSTNKMVARLYEDRFGALPSDDDDEGAAQ